MEKKGNLFYSASFDPFNIDDARLVHGHAGPESKVIVGIEAGTAPTLFSLAQRVEFAKKSIEWYCKTHTDDWYENRSEYIEVVTYSGLPIYEAKKHNAEHFLFCKNQNPSPKFKLSRQIGRRILNYQIGYIQSPFYDVSEIADLVEEAYKSHEYIMLEMMVTPPVHNMMMETLLRQEYELCCRASGISWEDFCKQMSTRDYHNLSHISYMLNKYRLMEHDTNQADWFIKDQNIKAAIFFHDYIPDDEEKSFEASGLHESCKGLFLATKHLGGLPETLSKEEQIIHDLDLAIFTDKALYQDYFRYKLLKGEYAHVPYNEYVEARCKLLEELKKEISERTLFTEKEKSVAIQNINAELNFFGKNPSKD